MSMSDISRRQAQYAGYIFFILAFIAVALPLMVPLGFKVLILIPIAFSIGMVGFWLGGFMHKKMQDK
ncbi:hypothetical protein [Methanococcoides sp. AM1]|uniref:hypothetical protein n=1 Tax=Methanococcoides sp. AM1 TaxID=1201011 RepID=UPI001083B8C4|nr:hypothetical protein [Methanococcoides sp. AM1]